MRYTTNNHRHRHQIELAST